METTNTNPSDINVTKRTDIYSIDPRSIVVEDGFNVRQNFDIDELKEQIKEYGVLNPITVIPIGKGEDEIEKYQLVDGERRLRATLAAIAEGADIKRIKAIMLPRNTKMEARLIEQVMRNEGKQFNEYEFALMFQRFVNFGYTITEIAAKFGKSYNYVSNCLELLNLAPEIQERIGKGEISANAVRQIVKINGDNEREQVDMVNKAVDTAKEKGKKTASFKNVPINVQLLNAMDKATKSIRRTAELAKDNVDEELYNKLVELTLASSEIVLALKDAQTKADTSVENTDTKDVPTEADTTANEVADTENELDKTV
jgi:ParB family chromosome partitioning protein